MKTVSYWHRKRHVDQWNGIESPELNPSIYSHHPVVERMVSSTNSAGKTGETRAKQWNWTPVSHHSQRWIQKESKKIPKTWYHKLLEENVGKKLISIGHGSDFLDMMPKAQTAKAKTSKWDYIKLRSFCIVKETINKMKNNLQNGKKKCAHTGQGVNIPNIYKDLIQLNQKIKIIFWLKN